MARREDYDWRNMSDEMLKERLKQEEWKAKHKHKTVDRAMAFRNVDAIVREQTRRFEERFLN